MGFKVEDDCVGCERCAHCDRDHIEIRYCDKCEEHTDELFYDLKGREVCWECYKEQFLSKICDDCDETKCSNCGSEAEEMFRFGSEWYCESCLKDMAERVNV